MNIPTPNQIPVPLDLSELPDHILRSGAVEALTNQNEDLMARLSVVLRKTSKLEDQIAELEKIIQIQTHKLSVGHDQLMIYQEKEKTVLEKNKKQEVHYLQLKEQIQLLEMQYAELFTTSKNRTQSLNQQLERVGRRLQRYIRYRARIKMGVKSLRKKIKLNQNEWNRLNNEHREMKLRLGDAIERIQYLSRTHENNQKQLVENYESSLKELQKKLDHKEKQCEVLEFKTQKQEELFEQNITLENRAILAERKLNELQESMDKELLNLQTQVAQYRGENKTQSIALESYRKNEEELKMNMEEKRQQILQFQDQTESLQLLWQDGQQQKELLQNKNQALQKLNQQLSRTVVELRQQNQQLQQRSEAQKVNNVEKIKEIKALVQIIKNEDWNKVSQEVILPMTEGERILARLDHVIGEIQTK